MDVSAKDFHRGFLVLLQQRCSCKTDEHRIVQYCFHHLIQLAALGTVTFINKDKDLPLSLYRVILQFFDKRIEIGFIAVSEFMDEGTNQPWT